jgi:uridine kinase
MVLARRFLRGSQKAHRKKMMRPRRLGAKTQRRLIVHISGASGSGKTTLGKKLKKAFGAKIVVKDLDELRHDFSQTTYGDHLNWKTFDSKAYQAYLDAYISSVKKPWCWLA